MKKTILAVSIFAALVMSGCRPETRNQMLGIPDDAILLSTENFSDVNAKTSVSGTSVQWEAGDKMDIWIGSTKNADAEVAISGSNAYVSTSLSGSGDIHAYYPTGTTSSGNTNYPNVKLPATYACSVVDGRQVIALPMVAKAASGATAIEFKHITAAVNVMLKNSLGTTVYIDEVDVISEAYELNSPYGFSVDFSADNPVVTSYAGSGTARNKVSVTFSDNDFMVLDGSMDKSIQVPIRPIGDDNLTIEVYCHDATNHYRYSYKSTTTALGRNQMLTAKVNLNTSGHAGLWNEVNLSTKNANFTASNGDVLIGTPGTSGITCTIPDGVTVSLKDVVATSKFLYLRATGDAKIVLVGTNSMKASSGSIIHVVPGNTITIEGSGSLTATGTGYNAAAIGSYGTTACGDIIINSGTITASASSYSAAIGAGGNSGACGNITINGGTINATGASGAAGIGTGSNSSSTCGNITIGAGVTSVTATKGSSAIHSIGKGNPSSTCGTVTIGGNTGYIEDSPYTYTPSSSK